MREGRRDPQGAQHTKRSLQLADSEREENLANSAIPPADEELVERIQAGDRAAETTLFVRYRMDLLEFLHRRGCIHDAEDLLHDAYMLLLAKIRGGTLHTPERVRFYLGGILKNLWIKDVRKSSRRRTSSASDWIEQVVDGAATPDILFQRTHESDAVRANVYRLNVCRDRDLILDFYLHELDRKIICERYRLSEAQLSRVLYRARQRLREIIEGQADRVGVGGCEPLKSSEREERGQAQAG